MRIANSLGESARDRRDRLGLDGAGGGRRRRGHPDRLRDRGRQRRARRLPPRHARAHRAGGGAARGADALGAAGPRRPDAGRALLRGRRHDDPRGGRPRPRGGPRAGGLLGLREKARQAHRQPARLGRRRPDALRRARQLHRGRRGGAGRAHAARGPRRAAHLPVRPPERRQGRAREQRPRPAPVVPPAADPADVQHDDPPRHRRPREDPRGGQAGPPRQEDGRRAGQHRQRRLRLRGHRGLPDRGRRGRLPGARRDARRQRPRGAAADRPRRLGPRLRAGHLRQGRPGGAGVGRPADAADPGADRRRHRITRDARQRGFPSVVRLAAGPEWRPGLAVSQLALRAQTTSPRPCGTAPGAAPGFSAAPRIVPSANPQPPRCSPSPPSPCAWTGRWQCGDGRTHGGARGNLERPHRSVPAGAKRAV